MATVDSRLDHLRSQIQGSSNNMGQAPTQPHSMSSSTEANSSGVEISPVLRSMKMEVPKFDGSDPNGWVFRIEEFFDFHGTPETLRLWINLKHRFGASLYDDPQGNLSKLSQTTTVAEFQTAFEDLMNRVTGISEPLLISFFITGLKPDIRCELLFARPSSLMEAFALAPAYEARAEEAKQGHRFLTKWNNTAPAPTTSSPSHKFQPQPYPLASTQPHHPAGMVHVPSHSQNTPPPPKLNTLPPLLPTPNLPIRRLTRAELHDKHEKGLCYNCDQKYSANHRCRSKFLLLMGTNDNEPASFEQELPPESVEEVITGDISSLNALAGQINPRSLRLISEVGSHSFQVLIDSGSTHNFIKPTVAERMGLPIQPTAPFRVYIGNGDFIVCKYFCPQVALTLQGTVFTLDIFVLPIKRPDVVLGIQWLQLLGRVSHDYSALSMEFCWNGTPVTLRGDLATTPSLITFNQLQSLVHNADISNVFALQQVPAFGEESATEEHLRHLQQVLECLHFYQFFVKLSKCLFCQENIDYLGHIVSASSVRADPQKIDAMIHWPTPQTTKQLRGFFGLTGYYRRFIRGYASLAAPLTGLLCKDAFKWTPTATATFDTLKKPMVEAPVLRPPDFETNLSLKLTHLMWV
ncbi:hypothetical protein KPL70_002017 [Citrus sinensis]|nr:hypothetical protein KPL70_002017 [Citrus sinensis]